MRAPETEQKQDDRAGGIPPPGRGFAVASNATTNMTKASHPARLNIPLIRARPEQKEIRLSERVMLLQGGLPIRNAERHLTPQRELQHHKSTSWALLTSWTT